MMIAVYIGAGIHMGATQGIIMSVIASNSPKNMIGTAFAIYYAIDGIFLFLSNYLAGMSYDIALYFNIAGSKAPFIQGIIASIAACCYATYLLQKKTRNC
jgi:MFS family permease